MLSYPRPSRIAPAIAAVITDSAHRVLLVLRSDCNLWGLPSGRIEPGEMLVDAVVREVSEETGLDVHVERLIGVYSDPVSQVYAYPSGDVVHYVTCCCLCTVVGGSARPDGVEVLDVEFFDTGKLPSNLLPMHPQWLADALASEAAAFVR